jgi:hypothetical protein
VTGRCHQETWECRWCRHQLECDPGDLVSRCCCPWSRLEIYTGKCVFYEEHWWLEGPRQGRQQKRSGLRMDEAVYGWMKRSMDRQS